MNKKLLLALFIASICCSTAPMESVNANTKNWTRGIRLDREIRKTSQKKISNHNGIYTNNREYENSINIETQIRDILGIDSYPEKKTLLDSIEAKKYHEGLRKKMLSQ